MIAVIFEVTLAEGCRDQYLDIAAEILPLLEEIEGFVSVERFQSLRDPDTLLSLSLFETEEAVQAWRKLSEHRAAQVKGRDGLFADYRIRVAQVIRDYGLRDRDQAPYDSREALEG